MMIFRLITCRAGQLRWVLLCCTTVLLGFSCRHNQATLTVSELEQELEKVLVAFEDNARDFTAIQLHVEAPAIGLSWSGARGVRDKYSKDAINPEDSFRIASITKTFVATCILLLNQEGLLSLDDSITKYISDQHLTIIENGGYDVDAITIHHLLNHTSGLFDYGVGSSTYLEKVKARPQKIWTRTEQIQGAMDWGQPQGVPGEQYHYSDTGYVLLGEIIEVISGEDLATALRETLQFEKSGLARTWLEMVEVARDTTGRIHQYFGDIDINEVSPTVDLYGGGGLVSTTKDVARFFLALHDGNYFENINPHPLYGTAFDLTTPPQVPASVIKFDTAYMPDYRYGIERIDIMGYEAFSHSGIWGTWALVIPELDASIVLNISNGAAGAMPLKKAVSILARGVQHLKPGSN